MSDIGLPAFSLFFMGSASFLDYQRRLAEGNGRSNCQTLFGIQKIPTDPHIRSMLDGVPTAAFDLLFYKAIETGGVLNPFKRLDGRILIALDGTEHFCSRQIHCRCCSSRKRSDGGTEDFHFILGASIVAPGHQQMLPLPPEFIAPQEAASLTATGRYRAAAADTPARRTDASTRPARQTGFCVRLKSHATRKNPP